MWSRANCFDILRSWLHPSLGLLGLWGFLGLGAIDRLLNPTKFIDDAIELHRLSLLTHRRTEIFIDKNTITIDRFDIAWPTAPGTWCGE